MEVLENGLLLYTHETPPAGHRLLKGFHYSASLSSGMWVKSRDVEVLGYSLFQLVFSSSLVLSRVGIHLDLGTLASLYAFQWR